MLTVLKDKIVELVKGKISFNLFGENGCGKTTLIKEIFEIEKIFHLNINVTHFINIKNFYEIIESNIQEFLCNSYLEVSKEYFEENIKIKKFSDLFSILEDYHTVYETYLIIDGLENVEILLAYKKYIQKFLALNSNFPKLKIIFISNFDLAKSEISNFLDFSNFLSLNYPAIKNDTQSLKEIVTQNLKISASEFKLNEDTINNSTSNYLFNFCNLNEYIYSLKENLDETLNLIKSNDYNVNELTDEINRINLTGEIEKFKNKNKIDFILKNDIDNETLEFIDKINHDKKLNNSKFKKIKLGVKIYNQTTTAPIHIKNLSGNDNESNFMSNINSNKNLTESLSFSQKLILLASFLATESSPKLDTVVFLTAKRTKQKIRKSRVQSLKSTLSHSFTIQRLIAIYTSLESLKVCQNEIYSREVDIELISDINTLINLNLIRYVRLNDINFHSRKLMTNVGIDFAQKIALDIDIKIEDFIQMDQF